MKKIIAFILATIMMLGMFSIGTFAEASLTLDIQAVEGASVRIGTVAGIRFKTKINKVQLDAIVAEKGEANVEIGTLITPTEYVRGAGAFTMEALDAYKITAGFSNDAYVKVLATYGSPFETEGDYYIYAGSLENILPQNEMLEFSGIGYVKIGEEVVYADYNEFNSSRTVGYVAYRAYLENDSNLGANGKSLIDGFANKFLVAKLGEDAPDISVIRYFEAFDDKADCEYSLATSLLGWSAANYTASNVSIYRPDIQAKYKNGMLIFNAPTVEGATVGTAGYSGFLKIPDLDANMYAEGDTHLVMEFDLKITAGDNTSAIGVAYCSDDTTNFARAIPIYKSNEKALFYLNNTSQAGFVTSTVWKKSLGCDFSANTVNVRFEWKLGDPAGELYINGTVLTDYGHWGNGNTYAVEECNLGLFFTGAGTYEVDNLLVYSYGDGGGL